MIQRLTIERVMQVSLFLMLAAMVLVAPTDTDTWWHLRSGQQTLTEGFIREDVFSHTQRGTEWINHSWGAQVILYAAYASLADLGLALYTLTLALVGMFFVYRTCEGNTYFRAVVVVIAAATAAVFWSARPQMFSFALSAVYLAMLRGYRSGERRSLWVLVPLMALWGNLHAGFTIGFILMLGFVAGEGLSNLLRREGALGWRAWAHVCVVGLLAAAVLIVNPVGWKLYLIPFQTVGVGVLHAYIQEWQPPNFQSPQVYPFIFLLALLPVSIALSPRRPRLSDWVLLGGTLALALTASRNIALFAVVAAPILSAQIHAISEQRGWRLRPMRRVSPLMGAVNVLLVMMIALGVALRGWVSLNPQAVARTQAEFLPLGAVAHLQTAAPVGTLFNTYNWGGYLIWKLPEQPVFVDGRTDMYGDAFLMRYLEAYVGDDWQAVFAEYGIGTVLVEVGSPLDTILSAQAGWQATYRDAQAVVFIADATGR